MNGSPLWSIANALACGLIAYFVGFPHVQAGRRLPLRATVARTLVASMAAGICASIILRHYGPKLEVVLNITIAFAAYVRHGDIVSGPREPPRSPDA